MDKASMPNPSAPPLNSEPPMALPVNPTSSDAQADASLLQRNMERMQQQLEQQQALIARQQNMIQQQERQQTQQQQLRRQQQQAATAAPATTTARQQQRNVKPVTNQPRAQPPARAGAAAGMARPLLAGTRGRAAAPQSLSSCQKLVYMLCYVPVGAVALLMFILSCGKTAFWRDTRPGGNHRRAYVGFRGLVLVWGGLGGAGYGMYRLWFTGDVGKTVVIMSVLLLAGCSQGATEANEDARKERLRQQQQAAAIAAAVAAAGGGSSSRRARR